jgi:hypothetical protein
LGDGLMSYSPLPSGVNEAEVLLAIKNTGDLLSKRFAFGQYEPSDIRSLISLYTYEALSAGRYDPTRPIGPFVYTNSKNRLINLHRDERRRVDSPCTRCHAGDPCGPDGQVCKKFEKWDARQKAKESVNRPLPIDHVSDRREPRTRQESPVEASAEANDLESIIDTHLPVELRQDYLMMRSGQILPKVRRERVQIAVMDALEAAGLGLEDYGL